ncbi:MAG: hypothetical protein IKZ09_10820 [Clostridia bacterium]|nr:hypothetical protein [Clostridia bacterium]
MSAWVSFMYNQKFAEVLDRYEAFWEHRSIGRPILNISTCSDYSWYKEPADIRQQWLDEELIVNNARGSALHSTYFAEGAPSLFSNLGPGMLAACIGGSFTLASDTVWFDQDPIVKDWDNMPEIAFNENSELWQHLMRIQKRALQDGNFPVSLTDLGGIMDVVASLRGTEDLLYDLYDYPEEVRELTIRVREIWLKAYDMQVALCGSTGLPYTSWMNIPSKLPWFPIQSDFCALISPKQFEQFILEDVIIQSEHMPRSIYHLDGPGEICHLDMLLNIPRLTGIQWVAGAGKEPLTDPCWFDMYKKIQDKKKNIVLLGAITGNNMADIERLVKTIDPTGVYISGSVNSVDDGNRLVENITRWCE